MATALTPISRILIWNSMPASCRACRDCLNFNDTTNVGSSKASNDLCCPISTGARFGPKNRTGMVVVVINDHDRPWLLSMGHHDGFGVRLDCVVKSDEKLPSSCCSIGTMCHIPDGAHLHSNKDPTISQNESPSLTIVSQ